MSCSIPNKTKEVASSSAWVWSILNTGQSSYSRIRQTKRGRTINYIQKSWQIHLNIWFLRSFRNQHYLALYAPYLYRVICLYPSLSFCWWSNIPKPYLYRVTCWLTSNVIINCLGKGSPTQRKLSIENTFV